MHGETLLVALGGALGSALFLYESERIRREAREIREATHRPILTNSVAEKLSGDVTEAYTQQTKPLTIDQLNPQLSKIGANHYNEWRKIVQLDPNTPHIIVHGSTGDGKSYTSTGLAADRQGKVLVVDPGYRVGSWGQLPVVTAKDGWDYDPINYGLAAILQEMERRAALYQKGIDSEELTVIVDEVPVLRRKCDLWPEFIQRVSAEARKYSIRLVLMSQSLLVGDLGLEGHSQHLNNFAIISLGDFARDIARRNGKVLLDTEHVAVLPWRGEYYELDLSIMPELNAIPIPRSRRASIRGLRTIQ